MKKLRKQIRKIINSNSAENGSNTPDYILAEYLVDCLHVFDKAVNLRSFYGEDNLIESNSGLDPVAEQDRLTPLKNMIDIQGKNGNWNYDPYMHGMFNGLECALSTLENREPIYKQAPNVWLCDLVKDSNKFIFPENEPYSY